MDMYSGMRDALSTWTAIFVMERNMGTLSVSWKGAGVAPVLRTGAAYDEQRHTIVERDVGAGYAVGDARARGEYRDSDLVPDVAVSGGGESGGLLVPHSYWAHTEAGSVTHDLDDGASREPEQGLDALIGY